MQTVNRSAIGLAPRQPLIAWSIQVSGESRLSWDSEDHSLYLLPSHETREDAEAHLQQAYEEIFRNELASWSPDPGTWPSPLSYALFRDWFEIRFYDLIEDLAADQAWEEPLQRPDPA